MARGALAALVRSRSQLVVTHIFISPLLEQVRLAVLRRSARMVVRTGFSHP